MMYRTVFVLTLALLGISFLMGQDFRFSVENPSSEARMQEPVIISWPTVRANLRGATATNIHLRDERGTGIILQVDDLDFDGSYDELTFVTDFTPRERRSFILRVQAGEKQLKPESARTDAGNWKKIGEVYQPMDDDDGPGLKRNQVGYRFDGVGWESEIVGYRVYLDERNAVDIQGKRKPGLHWNMIGETGVDYQQDADWGMDVLHVGPALGIGGIGFWVADSVLKPENLDRRRCRIVSRGPVRAVVRVDYTGWNIGGEKVDVASIFTIYEGDRVTEHRVILEQSSSPRTLVTGIVKHSAGIPTWNPEKAQLSTMGPQSRINDDLLMALNVDRSSVVGKTEDAYGHLILLNLEPGKPLRFLISSVWKGETGSMWPGKKILRFLDAVSLRLHEPVQIVAP